MTDPHPASAALAWLSAREGLTALAGGSLTSSDWAGALLDRIATVDHSGPVDLRSVLALAADAREVASLRDTERRSGAARGALHGVPVMVKDNIEAVGLPGTAGSLALAGRQVTQDAPLVRRLREAGAIVVGATNLSEWANIRSTASTSGWSAVGGLTANPWALDRSAGGSSSGSGAAVAAGLVPLAVGTETDGSITCPASLNGVVGIKPTVGSVSTEGVVPVSNSQDVPGPLARSVRDAALMLEVLSDVGGLVDACDQPVSDVRLGVARSWFTGHAATDALVDGILRVVESTGAAVSDSSVPAMTDQVGEAEWAVLAAELRDDLDAYLSSRDVPVRSLAEVIAFNVANADTELAHFGQDFFEMALASGGRAAQSYRDARERALAWAREECFEPALSDHDVLIAPAYAPAWKNDFVLGHHGAVGGKVTSPAALLGWPIVTIPCGLVGGLPVGLSFVGRAGSEALLVRVAAAAERALGLGDLRPAFAPVARG